MFALRAHLRQLRVRWISAAHHTYRPRSAGISEASIRNVRRVRREQLIYHRSSPVLTGISPILGSYPIRTWCPILFRVCLILQPTAHVDRARSGSQELPFETFDSVVDSSSRCPRSSAVLLTGSSLTHGYSASIPF